MNDYEDQHGVGREGVNRPAGGGEPSIPEAVDSALRRIRKLAGWNGPEGERLLASEVRGFELTWPEWSYLLTEAIEAGREFSQLCGVAMKASQPREIDPLRERVLTEFPWGSVKFEEKVRRGQASRARRVEEQARRAKWKSLSDVFPRNRHPEFHGSDLRALSPDSAWTVVIDETGSDFGEEAADRRWKEGKFVAVVIPGSPSVLPDLVPGWHAVDCPSLGEIDRVVQRVLDAPVAVVGVRVGSLPLTPGDRWLDGVRFLIDWVLRLLPLDGKTRLRVLVENREPFHAGDNWRVVERDCLSRLAWSFPERAAAIKLDIEVIGKSGSGLNGYADAVAFTWSAGAPSSAVRLRRSGWLDGQCLLEEGARELLHAWDTVAQGVHLPAPTWWELLAQGRMRGSWAGLLLSRVGEECRSDLPTWRRFLDETRQRMAAGAVEIGRLGDAVNWLESYRPEEAVIPPLLHLSWMVVQLARTNHLGEAESALEAELEQLAIRLVEEAAPFVCHAELHLAVARTNRFDFDGASRVLRHWRDVPAIVPGLQYWGQVRSSLGQHAAFRGDQAVAVALFDEALAAFGRLSDPAGRLKEMEQTNCYRAIAMMDDAAAEDHDVREAVVRVTGPLEETLRSLPLEEEASRRYSHHLLLRWLVHRRDKASAAAYLETRCGWSHGEGHPWPLIELYRGILLRATDPDEAVRLALEGAHLAFEARQGPVVRLIGACGRVVAADWGEPWKERDQELRSLKEALPLAEGRIDALARWVPGDGAPVDLLRRVLPFNFR